MLSLALVVVAIALPDSINPSLILTDLYLAAGPHPRRRTATFAIAAFAITFLGGVVIALGLADLVRSLLPQAQRRGQVLANRCRWGGPRCWRRGDLGQTPGVGRSSTADAFLECYTDDIDYRAAEGAPDDHGPIKGKGALRAFVQDWLDTFDEFKSKPVELIDAGEDNVITVIRISGRAKLSGVETDLTYAELSTLRDGKIARGRQYFTRDQALEAAGLSE